MMVETINNTVTDFNNLFIVFRFMDLLLLLFLALLRRFLLLMNLFLNFDRFFNYINLLLVMSKLLFLL